MNLYYPLLPVQQSKRGFLPLIFRGARFRATRDGGARALFPVLEYGHTSRVYHGTREYQVHYFNNGTYIHTYRYPSTYMLVLEYCNTGAHTGTYIVPLGRSL